MGLGPRRIVILQRFPIVKVYQQDYVILYMILQLKVILILNARASVNIINQKIVFFLRKRIFYMFLHIFYELLLSAPFGTSF